MITLLLNIISLAVSIKIYSLQKKVFFKNITAFVILTLVILFIININELWK